MPTNHPSVIVDFPTIMAGHNRVRKCLYGVMVYPEKEDIMGRSLDLYGEYAESVNSLLKNYMKPGHIVLDVGANLGPVTLCMARAVGPQGRVISFEPQRLIFQDLCASVALNGLTHVHCLHAAAGDTAGSVRVPSLNVHERHRSGEVSVSPNGDGEKVPLMTIDQLNLEQCHLIKIDVEGMEPEVVRGALKTINRFRPVIYTEANEEVQTGQLIRLLQENDYCLYWHFGSYFRKNNFRNNPVNYYAKPGDMNILCLPAESNLTCNLAPVSGPEAEARQDIAAWQERNAPQAQAK